MRDPWRLVLLSWELELIAWRFVCAQEFAPAAWRGFRKAQRPLCTPSRTSKSAPTTVFVIDSLENVDVFLDLRASSAQKVRHFRMQPRLQVSSPLAPLWATEHAYAAIGTISELFLFIYCENCAVSCPNDCSGRGQCLPMGDISKLIGSPNRNPDGQNLGTGLTYAGWESSTIFGCVCDWGYYGADCSRRKQSEAAVLQIVGLICEALICRLLPTC